jgi:hypothetical protein
MAWTQVNLNENFITLTNTKNRYNISFESVQHPCSSDLVELHVSDDEAESRAAFPLHSLLAGWLAAAALSMLAGMGCAL